MLNEQETEELVRGAGCHRPRSAAAMTEDEPLTCLDEDEHCRGNVEYRMPLSPSGRPFPRCDHHWEKRLDQEERNIPDSDVPPDWFDPTYAGERWEGDY